MTARILLIEDEPSLLELFSASLNEEGYAVTAFNTLAEVTADLDSGHNYDLAVLDFWVGKETSLGILKALRALKPDLPIIFMSGGADDLSLEMASALAEAGGATEFLFKPFKVGDLLTSVSTVLRSA
ncbi:response regulator [Roseibium sp.]|uniref:response regulator n=1 Tax=Roseibium sp. TaxID=1936156 RepID=UPI003BA9C1DC